MLQLIAHISNNILNDPHDFITRYFGKRTSTAKHGGGRVMVWGYFAASGPGRLYVGDEFMNFASSPENPEGGCPAIPFSSCSEAQAHLGYAAGQSPKTPNKTKTE